MRKALLTVLASVVLAGLVRADVDLTIDTRHSASTPVKTLFGHYRDWTAESAPGTTEHGILLQAPSNGLIRFSGGSIDEYHWRRGVGPANKRPLSNGDPNYSLPYKQNTFGTDEFMAFIGDTYPDAKPVFGANWWDFNRPGRDPPEVDPHHQPASGIQEAANWVEYSSAFGGNVQHRTLNVQHSRTGGLERTALI